MDNEFLLGQLAASMKNMEQSMAEIKEHLKSCPVRESLNDHIRTSNGNTKYTATTVIAVIAIIMQPILKLVWK